MSNNTNAFELNLYRKVRYFRREENAPVTLEDLLDYRWRLIQGGMPHDPLIIKELRTIEKWIKILDLPYQPIDDPTDLKKMHLAPVFTDEMFESLLPIFIKIITNQSDWVCLFHVMIYDGWMYPADFPTWVDWLNERAEAIGHKDLVSNDSSKKVPEYLKTPSRIKWIIEDYAKAQNAKITRVKNYCLHICDLCDQIREILGTIQEKVFSI